MSTLDADVLPVPLQYIGVLRKCKMRERLRTARQAMQERFPLTDDLWLDWLADEREGGAEPSHMTQLYDLAVGDYLSIPLWEDYVRCAPCASFLPHVYSPACSPKDACLVRLQVCGGPGTGGAYKGEPGQAQGGGRACTDGWRHPPGCRHQAVGRLQVPQPHTLLATCKVLVTICSSIACSVWSCGASRSGGLYEYAVLMGASPRAGGPRSA